MHQSQIEQFQNAWMKKYTQLLLLKRDALIEILKHRNSKDVHAENLALNNLATINFELELAIVEHDLMTNSMREQQFPNTDVN